MGRDAEVDGALWVAQGIPAPARRALVAAGILTVEDLRRADPDVLARLHGMGPKALALLRQLRDG
jgi:predicted RecB family nuclease